jgi:uncharacterized membrane protein
VVWSEGLPLFGIQLRIFSLWWVTANCSCAQSTATGDHKPNKGFAGSTLAWRGLLSCFGLGCSLSRQHV